MPLNKSSINFGLVYIPINYITLVKPSGIDFTMLDRKSMGKIRYKKVNELDGKEVNNKDIVKGYEYEENKYVIFEPKDFDKLKTFQDKTINILKFVDISEIDPIYYDKPYYVVSNNADHAFYLLAKAMEKKKKVGIAKTVIGQKEALIIIRSKNGRLFLNTLFFAEEIKDLEYPKVENNFTKEELAMAETLIDNMSGSFDINDYKNTYEDKLKEAIKEKIAGKEIKKPKEKSRSKKITSLMEALNESIKATSKKGTKK